MGPKTTEKNRKNYPKKVKQWQIVHFLFQKSKFCTVSEIFCATGTVTGLHLLETLANGQYYWSSGGNFSLYTLHYSSVNDRVIN